MGEVQCVQIGRAWKTTTNSQVLTVYKGRSFTVSNQIPFKFTAYFMLNMSYMLSSLHVSFDANIGFMVAYSNQALTVSN